MTNSPTRRLVITAVGLALAAAACETAGPKTDPPAPVTAGVCVAAETKDEGDLVPDLTTIVDCNEPHVYEVYDLIDLPAKALSGSTRSERIDNRDDLALPSELPDDSPERQAFEKFAEQECTASLKRISGYDGVKLRDATAEDAQVVPALRGIRAPWYTVMPEDEWLEGRRQVVCSARFEESGNTDAGRTPVKPQISKDDRMLIETIRDESLPVGFRQCRGYNKKRTEVSPISCTDPHVDEALFYFEADAVFGKKFVNGIGRKPTAKKFDRFDDVCTDALPRLLGPNYDTKALRGFGSVARRWTEQYKTVRCAVGPVKFRSNDLPPGSLIGTGAKKVELVRAK